MTTVAAAVQRRLRRAQRGAALLTAMLIVTLVATLAAAALWRQWRAVEIEAAERTRVQSAWVLVAALDWSRLILRADLMASAGVDHLGEPWAVVLSEARLSSFLAADKNIAADALEGLPDAFMSGRIVDAQSKLNVRNLVQNGQPVQTAQAAFARLFELLGLPLGELQMLVANLRRAGAGLTTTTGTGTASGTGTSTGTGTSSGSGSATGASGSATGTDSGSSAIEAGSDNAAAPLMPQTLQELVWLGLSQATVEALEPYVTVLPNSTPLNVNTATAEALAAGVPGLDLASARRLVQVRANVPFKSLDQARAAVSESQAQFAEGQQSVGSSYFETYARLRLDRIWVEERSLIWRNNSNSVTIVWRQRGAGATPLRPTP